MIQDLGKISVLIAGGGSRGIVSGGGLRALNDFGIVPHHLSTSSSGTLNGLMYAEGDFDKLERMWMNIKTKDVYKKTPFSYLRAMTSDGSVYDSTPLKKLLNREVNPQDIKDNFKGDFFINSTDLNNGVAYSREVHSLTNEEIITLAFASASPPIFFPPVMFDNLYHTDSGISSNYPILQAIEAGCDSIILFLPVNKTIGETKIKNIFDMIKSVLSIATFNDLELQTRSILKINKLIDQHNIDPTPDFRPIKLVIITPDKDLGIDFLDFDFKGLDRKELIKYGYDLAMRTLSKELDH